MDEDRTLRALAEKIRAAYLETAIDSYEDAAANGLCAQGAWECAVDAMRRLEISDSLKEAAQANDDQISKRLPSGSRR
jgi:hypothetical protein